MNRGRDAPPGAHTRGSKYFDSVFSEGLALVSVSLYVRSFVPNCQVAQYKVGTGIPEIIVRMVLVVGNRKQLQLA
jgi:hypothetical protein